jgi:hypothetical protein
MGQRRSLGSALPYVWIASLGRMLANKGHDLERLDPFAKKKRWRRKRK